MKVYLLWAVSGTQDRVLLSIFSTNEKATDSANAWRSLDPSVVHVQFEVEAWKVHNA
jgi:hypothetical protein